MKKGDVLLMLGAAVLLSAGAAQAKGLDAPVTLNGISAQRMTDKELAAVEAKGNFPKGECTWYVDDQVRHRWGSNFTSGVPWQGNAGQWYDNSHTSTLVTWKIDTPIRDSIVVYKAGGGYSNVGHVAYVESAFGKEFTVAELNYGLTPAARSKVNRRDTSISKEKGSIAGFICKKSGGVPRK